MARRRPGPATSVDLRSVLIEREREMADLYASVGWPRHHLDALEDGRPVTVYGWQVPREHRPVELDPQRRYVLTGLGTLTPEMRTTHPSDPSLSPHP